MATRFYCPDPPQEDRYELHGEEAHHLTRVCRHRLGDQVELFDGAGFATLAEIVEIHRERVLLRPVGDPLPERRPPCELSLITAVPKGERFDWLVEKATELGVARLIPLLAERSVVEPGGSKLERLRRRIIEASKQCGRSRLMILAPSQSLESALQSELAEVRLIAQPGGAGPHRWPQIVPGNTVVLAVGPEGGFTSAELDLAVRSGCVAACFNLNTLRVETAALAGAAVIFARLMESPNVGTAMD